MAPRRHQTILLIFSGVFLFSLACFRGPEPEPFKDASSIRIDIVIGKNIGLDGTPKTIAEGRALVGEKLTLIDNLAISFHASPLYRGSSNIYVLPSGSTFSFWLDSVYTATANLVGYSVAAAYIRTPTIDMTTIIMPSSQPRSDSLIIRWSPVDTTYPMLVILKKPVGNAEVFPVPSPGSGRVAIPPSYLLFSSGPYKLGIQLNRENSVPLGGGFKSGSVLRFALSIEAEMTVQ